MKTKRNRPVAERPSTKFQTSIRLSADMRTLVQELATELNISKTDVLQLAIRNFAKSDFAMKPSLKPALS